MKIKIHDEKPNHNDYLEPIQVAGALGISRTSVYRLVRQPGFPAIRVGSLIRIPRDEFKTWLSDQLPPSGQAEASLDNGSELESVPNPEPEETEEPAYLPLSALLAVREELNTILPPPLSPEHFGMALIEEIGELVRTLRYGIWDRPGQDWEPGWCWWHWAEETKGQEMSAPSSIVREELADILLLILLHKTSYCGDNIVEDEFWDTCWLGRSGGTAWGQATLLHWIQAALILRNDPRGALFRFAELCESLGEGFGRREIETAYLAKAQRNRERLQGGER